MPEVIVTQKKVPDLVSKWPSRRTSVGLWEPHLNDRQPATADRSTDCRIWDVAESVLCLPPLASAFPNLSTSTKHGPLGPLRLLSRNLDASRALR